jgi:hypothetical protein
MASTTILDAPRAMQPAGASTARWAGTTWTVFVLLFSSACIIVGLLWDISWHMSIGRDTLWSPPHLLEQIGAACAGLACGWLALRTTFAGSPEARAHSVRFWGFRAPLGAWVAIWGALAMIFSVPFDDWWHNAYGLDVEILSPPHIVLLSGMIAIQMGAILLALGHQNRAGNARTRTFAIAYVFASGAMIAMVATTLSEFMLQPNIWRIGLTYQVAATAFPLFLVATARAGRLRFSATAAAAAFMLIFAGTQWILVQFPAIPRLTPIMRPVTNMVAFGFPMLLIAPAFMIDLVHRRRGEGANEWATACAMGIAFVTILVAVQWPFTRFLVSSPLARNEFFLAARWPYWTEPGNWQTQFWSPQPGTTLAVALLVAALLAIGSARAGLWWGSWLRRVQR